MEGADWLMSGARWLVDAAGAWRQRTVEMENSWRWINAN